MITLQSPVDQLIRLKDDIRIGLKKLGIHTVQDLLYHFPSRYADESQYVSIQGLIEGEVATVRATIKKIAAKKSWTSKMPMSEATIEDVSGTMTVIWFNQPYLAKMLQVGGTIELTGKVTMHKDKLALVNPVVKNPSNTSGPGSLLPIDSHDSLFASTEHATLTPVYQETRGVSSLWFHHAITRALATLETIPDHIPPELLEQYSLPGLKTAFIWIHGPKTKDTAIVARKRFAFDEIFSINVARQKERVTVKKQVAYAVDTTTLRQAQGKVPSDIDNFISRFGFPLTGAQETAIDHILHDLEQEVPMSRLLEGDVGSGKTAVAAVAAYATIMNRPFAKTQGLRPEQASMTKSAVTFAEASAHQSKPKQTFGSLQVAYMAPTEILAAQHFESFIELFRHTGISIALITGSGCRKFPSKVASQTQAWTSISRPQLSKWIANGEIPIVIGTHALIQKSLTFKHLALAIIDEQHRFGLNQRKGLAKKDTHFPHLLSMTATPIPRTLALTIYGDLDLSLLDQLPAGRKQVNTVLVTPDKREEVYEKIRTILKEGRQCYIICPRINPPSEESSGAARESSSSLLTMKNVMSEAKRLQEKVFPEYRIGILHSKMTKDDKENAMMSFTNHETDILVATSVVEVGVNVPNATAIIIEGAERFGLSQLHQLRGRVQRSSHQPHCYLFAEIKKRPPSAQATAGQGRTLERMKLFLAAKNGFELAEYDLQLRGTGELTGTQQWGISDIGMEALRNLKLVEAARQAAINIVAGDPTLSRYPLLDEHTKPFEKIHFE
ncbi:MAG: ATP-dependent DNA helicase RecG [Candidatus Paceibacterota bacterium]